MEAARCCQSSRSSGSSGTGPRALDRPGQGVLGGVLADAVLAGVHQRGDLGQVRAALGVGDGGDLGRPRARRGRDEGADPVPEPGVDDGGQGRSPRGRRGRSRSTWTAKSSGRRTAGPAGPAGWRQYAARADARRWHAARPPTAGRTAPRLSGRCPAACPAGCRPGPCARRTAGHTVHARPPGPAPSPAPSRPGPTSGPAAPRRFRWPGCNTRPRPWPGRGPPASRCTPGHSPCSGSPPPPPANPPQPRLRNCPCSSHGAWV